MRTHPFTPGRFNPDRCQVMLARYRCPYPKENHAMTNDPYTNPAGEDFNPTTTETVLTAEVGEIEYHRPDVEVRVEARVGSVTVTVTLEDDDVPEDPGAIAADMTRAAASLAASYVSTL